MFNKMKITDNHEWLLLNDDQSIITIGFTEYLKDIIGILKYIELPNIKTNVKPGSYIGIIESSKTAIDIYSPISGLIIEINKAAIDNPQIIHDDPYNNGWLYKINNINLNEYNKLYSFYEYQDKVKNTDL
jgi:glycine cleavage system H protein